MKKKKTKYEIKLPKGFEIDENAFREAAHSQRLRHNTRMDISFSQSGKLPDLANSIYDIGEGPFEVFIKGKHVNMRYTNVKALRIYES